MLRWTKKFGGNKNESGDIIQVCLGSLVSLLSQHIKHLGSETKPRSDAVLRFLEILTNIYVDIAS